MARPDQLRINEIFHSIQGEGTRAGQRCVFIRLTGCHLRCTYCDTEYSFHEGDWRTLDDILTEVRAYGCPFVEVTGGEPLLQPAVYALLQRLADEFAVVALETSGAVSIEKVDPRVISIVDLKTPSSGECERNHWPNIALLNARDELKFVIGDRNDYEWARDTLIKHSLAARCTVLFSPVLGLGKPASADSPSEQGADSAGQPAANLKLYQGHMNPQQLAEWILADKLPVQFSLQIHKFIWSPMARGV